MTHLLVRHNVADFAKWKPLYDAHLTARQNAGLQEKNLLRSVANPNEVVLLFEAEDFKRAQALEHKPLSSHPICARPCKGWSSWEAGYSLSSLEEWKSPSSGTGNCRDARMVTSSEPGIRC